MKNLIDKLNQIINYFYYLKSSIRKTNYPCKLVGEKILSPDKEQIIIFKALGKVDICYVPLSNLFLNKNLISCFSSRDAMQLGKIAFNNVILSLPSNSQLNQFHKIKNIMLSSTHDIYPSCRINDIDFEIPEYDNAQIHFGIPSQELRYPFKLVGYESNCLDKTIILYTIFGKREGHKKTLQQIIDAKIIEKFHPTEAIKFGFIRAGEEFFLKNIEKKEKKINDLSQSSKNNPL